MLRMVDEVMLKPVKAGPIVEIDSAGGWRRRRRFRCRSWLEEEPLRPQAVELVATLLERERAAITQAWLAKMDEAGSLAAVPHSAEEEGEHLPGALDEIVYRLRYAQPLGLMTLFSMASLQHGARRRRQGFPRRCWWRRRGRCRWRCSRRSRTTWGGST